jgi:hypothetical protein
VNALKNITCASGWVGVVRCLDHIALAGDAALPLLAHRASASWIVVESKEGELGRKGRSGLRKAQLRVSRGTLGQRFRRPGRRVDSVRARQSICGDIGPSPYLLVSSCLDIRVVLQLQLPSVRVD